MVATRSSCGKGKGTRMQQWIIDKPARYRRGSLLPWSKRLPGSVAANRPRGDGYTVFTNTYVLRTPPLRLEARNPRDCSLCPAYLPWQSLRGFPPRRRRNCLQE
jgi:hypothetical protein